MKINIIEKPYADNPYLKKYQDLINKAKNDKEISEIIDKIYSDGFEDGMNNEDAQ